MSKSTSQVNEEVDCEVNVYEGSWATCDMVPEEQDQEGRTPDIERSTSNVE